MSDKNSTENNLVDKNFGLTEHEFEILGHQLQQGNETLFEKAFLNHFKRSMNYLMKKNGANEQEAYDITMSTLIEFRKRIIQEKVNYGNINFLFTQMCSQRYTRSKSRNIDIDRYEQVNEQIISYDDETIELLQKALAKMGQECQSIIQDIYYNKISYKLLETKYNKTAASLRKQKERCVTKLKMLLRQQLNSL